MRILVGVVLFALPAAVHAQTAIQATGAVNVRSGPGTGYGVLGQVPAGHVYAAASKSGDWWKIWWNGGMGWTHGSLWTSPSGLTGVKGTVDTLNVRTGPGTGYGVIGQIYMGQIHVWIQYEGLGGWYKITFAGGVGYVHGGYVTRAALSGGAPTGGGTTTNLSMTHAYQQTNYWCGPATAHMTVLHETGSWISQQTYANYMGTDVTGQTYVEDLRRGINHYGGLGCAVVWSGFDHARVRRHINQGRCVPINVRVDFLPYWGTSAAWGHYSPIKGYTSDGYYIHDSWKGPNRWASKTAVWNAVTYNNNAWYARVP